MSTPVDRAPFSSWWQARPVLVWASSVLILVAGVVLWFASRESARQKDDPGASICQKGATLRWVVERDGAQRDAGRGFAFRAGDRIGWTMETDNDMFLAAFALDASGDAHPLGRERAGTKVFQVQASAPRPFTVPFSIRVTEPLEREMILVFLSRTELDVRALLGAVADLSGPEDEAGLRELAARFPDVQIDSRVITKSQPPGTDDAP